MNNDTTTSLQMPEEATKDVLAEILRDGARKMLGEAGWPMFFRTWGRRICSAWFVAMFKPPRLKNLGHTLAIES